MSNEQKDLLRILVEQKNIEGVKEILFSLNKKVEGQSKLF